MRRRPEAGSKVDDAYAEAVLGVILDDLLVPVARLQLRPALVDFARTRLGLDAFGHAVVGDDVVEAGDGVRAAELFVELEILFDAFVGVVSVDVEEVYGCLAQNGLGLLDRERVVRASRQRAD